MKVRAVTDTAAEISTLESNLPNGTFLTLQAIGTTAFSPAPTIEATNRIDIETMQIDATGGDILFTVWLGVDRPHGMSGVITQDTDMVSVLIHTR